MNPSYSSSQGFIRRFVLLVFLCLFLSIGTVGVFFLRHQWEASKQAAQEELLNIAELKSSQISDWYQERVSDATVIFNNHLLQAQVRVFLSGQSGDQVRGDLLAWMSSVQKSFGYSYMALYGADGSLRLGVPSKIPLSNVSGSEEFQSVWSTKEVRIGDFHRDQLPGKEGWSEIHLGLWIPVLAKSKGETVMEGTWELQIDPHQFLYPRIQTWPTLSRTAETLLIRREGNEVVFLNELRHRAHTALSLRFPIEPLSRLPAAMVVQGKEGIVEGVDYRGVPVLAALRSIPHTPWFMVAKVDQEEIFAPLWERAWATGIILFLLVCMTATVLGLMEHRYSLELIGESEHRFHELFNHMSSGVAVYEAKGQGKDFIFKDLNRAGERIIKVKKEEVLGRVNWREWAWIGLFLPSPIGSCRMKAKTGSKGRKVFMNWRSSNLLAENGCFCSRPFLS